MTICSTAIIHHNAKIGANVTIGSYAVIGNCVIANDCIIHSHAFINDGVILEEGVEIFNGAVIGKEPKGAGATARPIEFVKSIHIGKNTSICPHAIIYYDVQIGERTLIGDGASIREQCRIGNECIISRYVSVNYNTSIGNRTKIMDLTHLTGNMSIGDEVFVSAMVGSANDNQIVNAYADHVVGPTLENNCIVGLGANLLPGVVIGEFALVAAGALVTKNIPPHQLAKGIPAKTQHSSTSK